MQEIIQLGLDKVIDELIHTHAAGRTHIFRTQLHFRLGFKDRFLHINSDSAYDTVSDIRQFLVLIEELLDRTSYRFAIRCLMGTALDGMLTVHE